jgi:hypothetical protein
MSALSRSDKDNSEPARDPRMNRSTAIMLSLRAFGWGFPAFLPVLGVLPASYVLRSWRRVRTGFHPEWNPAAGYLKAGVILASLGLLGTALILVSVFGVVFLTGGS